MKIFATILLVCIAGGPPFAHGQICPGTTTLNPQIRDLIVNMHNTLRSNLALGKEPMAGGKQAPQGKNIYKLVYDCDLEAQAQAYADKCVFAHSPKTKNASENLYRAAGGDISPAKQMPKAISSWWSELAQYGISDPQNRLVPKDKGVGHFTAMAWGKSTRVGCGYGNNCLWNGAKAAVIVCQYRQLGNYQYEAIYELGPPCTVDTHCTTFANSKCSRAEGTCYLK